MAAGKTITLARIRAALAKLDVTLSYDEFSQRVLVDGRPFDDFALDLLWVRLSDARMRVTKETLETLIKVDARKASFHPVKQYLSSLKWDGVARLDRWLIDYAEAEDTPFVRAASSLPLIAAVRRVRQPGAKFDELLVLESRKQGTSKSTALATLCPNPEWFTDSMELGVDPKIVIEQTAGKWIVEAAEMKGNKGRETDQLKAFLSRAVDGPVRLAYARLPVAVPRQWVMFGTTNPDGNYLKDPTGSRRIWPVSIGAFDIEGMTRDRDQLWAEAAHREAQGESIRLDPSLYAAAGEEQEKRREVDPWEEPIAAFLEGRDWASVQDIWALLGKEEARAQDIRASRRVASVMGVLSFYKQKARVGGQPPRWYWFRDVPCQGRAEGEPNEIVYLRLCSSVPSNPIDSKDLGKMGNTTISAGVTPQTIGTATARQGEILEFPNKNAPLTERAS